MQRNFQNWKKKKKIKIESSHFVNMHLKQATVPLAHNFEMP